MSGPLTVFMHFYNEEFLLPYWLKHHTRIFDHGVLIDYASTDRSREIIQELAPHWEVRPSRNTHFDALACDGEVMELEAERTGWKLALNATEFLFHHDLRSYVDRIERHGPGDVKAIGISSFVMADRVEDRGRPVTDEPLYVQRTHGYFDETLYWRRLRYLHREQHGAYAIGRHGTAHRSAFSSDLVLLWFGWSPYEQVRARKLQIQTRMPESDKGQGLGWQHLVTPEQLDAQFLEHAARAKDLTSDPRFRVPLEHLRAAAGAVA